MSVWMLVSVVFILAMVMHSILTLAAMGAMPYGKKTALITLPAWERNTLYGMAAYPMYSVLMVIAAYAIAHALGYDELITPDNARFLYIFLIAQLLLCAIAAALSWYVTTSNRKGWLLFMANSFVAACYGYAFIGFLIEGVE